MVVSYYEYSPYTFAKLFCVSRIGQATPFLHIQVVEQALDQWFTISLEITPKVNWGLEGTSDIMVTLKLGVASILL